MDHCSIYFKRSSFQIMKIDEIILQDLPGFQNLAGFKSDILNVWSIKPNSSFVLSLDAFNHTSIVVRWWKQAIKL